MILKLIVNSFSILPPPQDIGYPPLLFQILEDCWQQEHYLRPSAEHIHSTIRALTDLSIAENQVATPAKQSILLDSFTLHQEHRISAVHCFERETGLEACAAISGQDGSTAIVNVVYSEENAKSELQCCVSEHWDNAYSSTTLCQGRPRQN